NNNKDALVDGKEHDIQKSVSPDIHSLSSGFEDLNAEFEECNNNSSNGVNAASSLVSTARQNFINITNNFSDAGPLNAAMPNLEDLSHDAYDVGAEADINNLESIISVSPILTTRIHKDHPTSQIIGDLSSTTQTRRHTQEEGIDYEEVFAPVARMEAIRLFLAYASFMGFLVYQMDVKSAFLYGTIQ
nr:putative ribonuclease H-like domain-containing protein [Tanacetum cinerariifolium]